MNTQNWFTYIIATENIEFYTGITTDITRRWQQHSQGTGARYFRGRKPNRLCYLELHENRSLASKKESFIKSLKRQDKIIFISQHQTQTLQLATTYELPIYDFETPPLRPM